MENLSLILEQGNLKKEFSDFFSAIDELTKKENALYGRETKPRDFIVGFLSAGNVSEAKVRVNGELVDLDLRKDKPANKECELTEAATAVFELMNSSSVHEKDQDMLIELGMHVMSEVGDVLYNLGQLYLNQENLENWNYVKDRIEAIFQSHHHSLLSMFMLNIAEEKFSIRYFINEKKNVPYEEEVLRNKYGNLFLDILNVYGSLENLLKGVKEIIFSSLSASMEASYGADYLREQIVQAEAIILKMAKGSEM